MQYYYTGKSISLFLLSFHMWYRLVSPTVCIFSFTIDRTLLQTPPPPPPNQKEKEKRAPNKMYSIVFESLIFF